MEYPKISLCMIVKNEEDCIARCLNSVKHVVDEIIIVDTGSTDNTADICRSFDAQIVEYTWNEHFADARNYGLQYATGDWILWMDADEELDPNDALQLKQQVNTASEAILWIHLINFIGNEPDANDAFHITHSRMFRNHIGFKFTKSIHEILNLEEVLPEYDPSQQQTLPIKIYHYGYMNEYIINKKKSERNIRLLEQELHKEDHHPWIKYHIATEYYRLKQYQKAFEYVNLGIVHFLQERKAPPSLLYKLKYSILITLGSVEGAWQGIDRAILMYPDYVDLYFYKGVIYYLKEWYSQAIEVFQQCIILGENNIKHLTLKGVGSFHASYYIGLCHEKLGNMEHAIQAYEAAIQIFPNYKPALEAIGQISGSLNS
ncbi:glycosyltransferase [Paenibacillus sp. ACRRX]|uniref:tetratricopeptide repeat-containing glycosyltransferase family 2 protein n=1 Tax=Paenibacillus sp. ACRRX TaxID=2918206 RepID=UPI0031BADA9A